MLFSPPPQHTHTHTLGPLSHYLMLSHLRTNLHTHVCTHIRTLRQAKSSTDNQAKFISEYSLQTMHFYLLCQLPSEDQKPHSCLLMHTLWSINSPPILSVLCV